MHPSSRTVAGNRESRNTHHMEPPHGLNNSNSNTSSNNSHKSCPPLPMIDGDRRRLLQHPQQTEKLLTLAITYGSPMQWGAWLRLPLMGAAVEGDEILVKELLAAGADSSSQQMDPDGFTLLHCAADGGSEKVKNMISYTKYIQYTMLILLLISEV